MKLLALAGCALALTAQDLGNDGGLPLLVQVPSAPVPVRAGGKYVLVYELHLTSDTDAVVLHRVEAWGTTRLAVLEGEAIATSMRHSNAKGDQTTLLGAGTHAVVWMYVVVDKPPSEIRHRITGTVGQRPEMLTLEAGRTRPSGKPLSIRAPVRGSGWIPFNSASNESHHRRGWFAVGDRAIVPQRFAIDFARLHPDGKLVHGSGKENRDHGCYGAEAVAAAPARVHRVRDGLPENVPGNAGTNYTLDTIGGNMVVLDLGKGLYALYAHFQPGSIRVKAGDRVKAGQVLGLVGNSGNSTGPHLHFHVADGPSLIDGDGVPAVFDFYVGNQLHRGEVPLKDWSIRLP